MASDRLSRIKANKERSAAFFASVLATGDCFTWGDEEGVAPWEDRFGDTLVPIWPDELSAVAENQADADHGERPLRLELVDLAPRLRRWRDLDVGLAVHPVGGSIAGTYTVPQFAQQLLSAVAKSHGASQHPWVGEVSTLRPFLP